MSHLYFSWATADDTTWTEEFKRNDFGVSSMEGKHEENNFCTLTLIIKNPRRGLLTYGRWIWVAYESDDTAGTVTPIFYGQLIEIPEDLLSEALTVSFIAKAEDYYEQKMELALTLLTSPNYEPIFVKPELRPSRGTDGMWKGDPDVVLEGWPKLWHFDRVTGEVSVSHILSGEDGTASFSDHEIPRNSVEMRRAQAPLPNITVVGKIPWTQAGNGTGISFAKTFNAYNALSIAQSWPQTGQQLSGGWNVISASADDNGLEGAQVTQQGFRYENKESSHRNGDKMSISWDYPIFPCDGLSYLVASNIQPGGISARWEEHVLPAAYGSGEQNIPTNESWTYLIIAKPTVDCQMTLGYDAGIKRTETLTLKMAADLQEVILLPTATDPSTETVTLDGADVGVEIDGAAPLPDPTAYNFFPTDRGLDVVKHMICVGAAHLKQRARMVTIKWDTTFERAIELSCRMNASIQDGRLPGGTASGKIIAYTFSASGPDLQLKGTVTIGCCVGKGGEASAAAGTPSIADAGVFEDSIQVFTASTIVLGDEVSFEAPVYEAGEGELQFPLTREQVMVSESTIAGTMPVQIGSSVDQTTGQTSVETVNVSTETYRLELKSLTGTIDHVYDLMPDPLKLPKQIDLEAASWA